MKRLAYFLRNMDNDTSTYKELYEGALVVHDPDMPDAPPYGDNEPIYYNEGVGYEISHTHKLAQDKPTVTIKIPVEKLNLTVFDWACAAFCYQGFRQYMDRLNEGLWNRARPDEENGKYILAPYSSTIMPNNYAYFSEWIHQWYENASGRHVWIVKNETPYGMKPMLNFRIQVQLPKRKLRKTIQMLCRDLPEAVEQFIAEFDFRKLQQVRELTEKQSAIRAWLKESDYCAFVANGSILPRAKGTDLPMLDAIPFRSTPDDEIEIFGVKGMGIKKGVTVITGGGYSGKSTLLDAISAGIYDHAIGDGRELCITDESAVTISAEDGRSVKHVNISPFIKWLPGGDTSDFSTDHASGSTSQAANIMEAVDCGARLLLIDEDRSATNFMIRDRMMKELIKKEPITPFTDRVNELHKSHGVSTILVIGGSGEYLSVADKIYMMEDYLIHDVTERAKSICVSHNVKTELPPPANWQQCRALYSDRFSSYPENSGTERLKVSDMGFIIIGDETIDVRGLHDILSPRQLDTLGFMLRYLEATNNDRKIDIERKIEDLYARIDEEGIDFLYSSFFTTCERFLDLPRKQELMALINRMRRINMVKGGDKI